MSIDLNNLSGEKLEELRLHDKVIAKKYDSIRERNKFSRYYQDYWLNKILDNLKSEPKKVLDYCCGTASLYPVLKNRFSQTEYTGIDISREMIKVGQHNYGNSKNFILHQQDAENLDLKNDFDVVIARGAFHHLPSPARGIEQIHKVLKPGGLLIISEPVSTVLHKLIRKIVYRLNSHFSATHKSFYFSELKSLLNDNGFEIMKVDRFGFLAFPFGFPDIFSFVKYFPCFFLKPLVEIDNLLAKIPFVKNLSWSIIIAARKID
ncbi:MAG: methyltransferase domain-containing protein [Patescibacteria group bacterium]|nr:methyltransferase domain-containing protein [Patescibacteria group bacterium]MDD5554451.1 methyltransferase domain-containing protein [Patescibacteria group bacterium]